MSFLGLKYCQDDNFPKPSCNMFMSIYGNAFNASLMYVCCFLCTFDIRNFFPTLCSVPLEFFNTDSSEQSQMRTRKVPNLHHYAIDPALPFLSCLGIGGNLVSIQSSRISTSLHFNYSPGEVPVDRKNCYNPCRTFIGSGKDERVKGFPLYFVTWYKQNLTFSFITAGANHRSAQVLLLLVIPGQLVFLYAIHLMKGSHTLPSVLLTVAFLSASLIQVSQTYAIFFLCALHQSLTVSIISVS